MATQFSTLLKIALPTQGELSGSWGNTVNDSITKLVEEAISGTATINSWSTNSATLSTANGATAESRNAILNLTDTGTSLSGAATVIVPTLSKIFVVKNGTAQTVTVKTASGTGVDVTAGETCFVFCDGTNVVEALDRIAGNFNVGGNLTVDGNATITGTTTLNGGTLTLGDAASDNVVFGADVDSSIIPDDDNTFDLGSSSQQWRDIYINGSAYIDGLAEDILVATDKKVLFRDSAIFINSSAAGQRDIDADTEVEITTTTVDLNGNLDVSGTSTLTGNVTLGAQLRMPDNTGSKLLIADGTSYEEKAVGDLSEISSVANDDVLLAVDTTDGVLKRITKSTLVAGLATSSGLSNVVEDTSPQLGDDLDTNSFNIKFDDAHGINDDDDKELIVFQKTASAVNQFDITNAATGNAPEISATGDDTNISFKITPKGSGQVLLDGNVGIESGVIDLKNSGSVSNIKFYCESSNLHYTALQSSAHSAYSGNVTLTLPPVTDTLVGLAATQTLTNKTLTTPVIAEIDSSADITLDADADIVLDAAGGNIEFKDAGTLQLTIDMDGTAGAQVIQLGVDSDDLIFKQYDGTTVLTLDDDTTVKVATDLTVGDDLSLISDGAILSFGADSDVTLTHTADTKLTCNLVMEATTFEPTADTSTGDAAAIGFTSSEGIIITGQGSSNDVTIKNDADAEVIGIPTGTTNVNIVGVATAATFEPDGDTSTGDNAAIGYAAADGIVITGQGSTSDVTIRNDADAAVATVPTGTTIFQFEDDVKVNGRATSHIKTQSSGDSDFDLSLANNFKFTSTADEALTFSNPSTGQSGNIIFICADSSHTITAAERVGVDAATLTRINTAGTYFLSYYCTNNDNSDNSILLTASPALIAGGT